MIRIFNWAQSSKVQRNFFSALPNAHIIKKHLVDKGLNRLDATEVCKEPPLPEPSLKTKNNPASNIRPKQNAEMDDDLLQKDDSSTDIDERRNLSF